MLDSMVEDAEICYRALYEGRIDEWGLALDRVWNRKKKLASGISNPLIDEMYKCAKKAGALGGKILGAGGGGFLLVYAPEGRREDVRKALRGYRELDFSLESGGTQIIFSN